MTTEEENRDQHPDNVVSTNNLGQQNAVSNQQAVNELGLSTVAEEADTIGNLGPLEARSAVDILTNDELAQTIVDMKAFADQDRTGEPEQLSERRGHLTGEDITPTRDTNEIVVRVVPEEQG